MRVLVVAMVNSVHTARSLRQLRDTGWDVHLCPSTPAVQPHPLLVEGVTLHGVGPRPAALSPALAWQSLSAPAGWRRHLDARPPPGVPPPVMLARLVDRLRPDLIHSMETQAAGYLTAAARALSSDFPPWLHSCWGSDLNVFGRLSAHRERIGEVLSACDAFHADCQRDLDLARAAGFAGAIGVVMPVGGGFDPAHLARLRSDAPPSRRTGLMVKGYQGWAGRALTALRAVELCASLLQGQRITIYSASPDVQLAAELLALRSGLQLELLAPCAHDEMLRLHGSARVSIGLSLSDGISNSLMEAMAMGAFPIQSDTGCGCDWVRHGETALLVHPEDPTAVAAALRGALRDDALVDAAALGNARTVAERLDERVLRESLIALYREVAATRRSV